jgi:hypothetical protein
MKVESPKAYATNTAGAGYTPVASFLALSPEIAVDYPLGSGLVSGGSPVDFGTVATGFKSAVKTFTVKNTGTASLALSSIVVSGTGASDFALSTTGMATAVARKAAPASA